MTAPREGNRSFMSIWWDAGRLRAYMAETFRPGMDWAEEQRLEVTAGQLATLEGISREEALARWRKDVEK